MLAPLLADLLSGVRCRDSFRRASSIAMTQLC
jgi:hypothetical protein